MKTLDDFIDLLRKLDAGEEVPIDYGLHSGLRVLQETTPWKTNPSTHNTFGHAAWIEFFERLQHEAVTD